MMTSQATPTISPTVARAPDEDGGFLCLAPMDGVTDYVFRAVMTELHAGASGISLCVSEFVRITHQRLPPKVILRHCPELAQGGRTPAGVPVFVQLLGGDPARMAYHAALAADMGALGIDLNFGCPAKTVNNHDGGASLLRAPERVEAVTRAVRDAVPNEVPVTVKVRLGWDDTSQMATIARAAEQGGARWLTVHGRTRTQLYRPPIDWQSIADARRSISIPVVANGDIVDETSLENCRAASGCSAFMIGRGAMADPGLFARLRGLSGPSWQPGAMATLLQRYADVYLGEKASDPSKKALLRLKQWLRFAAGIRPEFVACFDRVKRCQQLDEALPLMHAELESLDLPQPAIGGRAPGLGGDPVEGKVAKTPQLGRDQARAGIN